MAVKYKNARPSKIYPDLAFWFEYIPSGNPAPSAYLSTLSVIIICKNIAHRNEVNKMYDLAHI
jgi:hypothetical protein